MYEDKNFGGLGGANSFGGANNLNNPDSSIPGNINDLRNAYEQYNIPEGYDVRLENFGDSQPQDHTVPQNYAQPQQYNGGYYQPDGNPPQQGFDQPNPYTQNEPEYNQNGYPQNNQPYSQNNQPYAQDNQPYGQNVYPQNEQTYSQGGFVQSEYQYRQSENNQNVYPKRGYAPKDPYGYNYENPQYGGGYEYQPQHYQYQYQPNGKKPKKGVGMCITSFVLGLVSMLCCSSVFIPYFQIFGIILSFIMPVLGTVFGIIGTIKCKTGVRGLGIAGMIISIVMILLLIATLIGGSSMLGNYYYNYYR